MGISIHALLAESDFVQNQIVFHHNLFLSTLSLRRATYILVNTLRVLYFYPRSPCGERLKRRHKKHLISHFYPRSPCGERHFTTLPVFYAFSNFYPRSPCGERLPFRPASHLSKLFLSTLSLRRATCSVIPSLMGNQLFLSTLSLRRATCPHMGAITVLLYFYPRSPCGERRQRSFHCVGNCFISIHALLAESDYHRILLRHNAN